MKNVFNPTLTISKAYTFWADPGHGWLAVPAAEIRELGIKPSCFSYGVGGGGMIYLEEDCDLGLFMRAKGLTPETSEAWFAANVVDRYVSNSEDLPFQRR